MKELVQRRRKAALDLHGERESLLQNRMFLEEVVQAYGKINLGVQQTVFITAHQLSEDVLIEPSATGVLQCHFIPSTTSCKHTEF